MNQDNSPQTWGTGLVIGDEEEFPMHVFLVFQDGSQNFMKTFVSYFNFCDLQGGLGVCPV